MREKVCINKVNTEIILELARSDYTRFDDLYAALSPGGFKFACKILKCPYLAEEVLQESFTQLVLHARQYRGSGTVSSWFLSIIFYRSMSFLNRKRKHEALLKAAQEAQQHTYDDTNSGVARVALRELKEAIQDYCTETAPQRAAVTTLYFCYGLSLTDIAKQTNRTLLAIKADLHRAREALKQLL